MRTLFVLLWISFSTTAAAGPAVPDIFEPDNSPAEAIVLSSSAAFKNRSIAPVGDEDWITFTLPGLRFVFLELRDNFSGVATALLLDSDLNEIDEFSFRMAQALEAGQYYVVAKSDVDGFDIAEYELHVSINPIFEDGYEDDDTAESGTLLEFGVSQHAHTIVPIGDADWFTLEVGTKGFPQVPIVIEVYPAPTSHIMSLALETASGVGVDSGPGRLVTDAPVGTLKLQVTEEFDDTLVTAYTIHAWKQNEPDIFEPDNAPAQAKLLGVQGTLQTRNLLPNGDEDWIKFFADADEPLNIVADNTTTGVTPEIEIYDSDGTTLLDGPEQFSLNFTTPATGFYFIRITNAETPSPGDVALYRAGIAINQVGVIPGTLAGTVSASGKAVVSGASVELVGFGATSTTSSTNGIYAFNGLPKDEYTVRAEASGYHAQTIPAVSVGGGVTLLDFELAPIVPATIIVTPGEQNVASESGTTSFAVSNAGDEDMTYSVALLDAPAWITVSSGASGGNAGTIELDFEANPANTIREATLRVSAVDAGDGAAVNSPTDVTIRQEAGEPVIDVDAVIIHEGASGGSREIHVTNGGTGALEWTAEAVLGQWISVNVAKVVGSGTITINIAANEASESRSGTVRVSSPGAANSPVDISIEQAGANEQLEDLNGDNEVDAVDVQIVINGALGAGPEADVNGDSLTDAVDVQLVINAALGL